MQTEEDKIKLSVIVPIYGVERYLNQALDSLIAQTMNELDIILIDDGNTDNCPKIIDEYLKKDKRIKVITKQNSGYASSCNKGLDMAQGEYVAIFEPDDYIDKNMYFDLYKIAKKYNSDIVKSPFYVFLKSFEADGEKAELPSEVPEDTVFKITDYPCFFSYHPSIWSCIYKKSFLDENKIRFTEDNISWSDNLFQVQTMCLANRINYTDKPYYFWRKKTKDVTNGLKDYKIPFQRSDEVRAWLEENSINDKGILEHIGARERAYIKIVLSMNKIPNKKECYKRIKYMFERMGKRCPNLTFLRLKNLYRRYKLW